MSAKEYERNREIAFEMRGLNPNDKGYNCHHIVFRDDVKRGRVPKDFPINAVDNLLPLPIYRHEALNCYISHHPELIDDVSNRQDLAHLAEIGELDHYAPIEVRKPSNPSKHKKHKRRK